MRRTASRTAPGSAVLGVALALLVAGAAAAGPPLEPEPGEVPSTLSRAPEAGEPRYDYDPLRAGHPLRIVAYALHPVGVALDYLVFRPAWWIGTHEPFRTIFGVTD